MEGRKWEDLNEDCLVQIFGRVGLKALIIALPFVCKSWYKATLNPFCWRILDFQLLQRETSRDINLRFIHPSTKFFKFVVDRSRGTALQILLPKYCSFEALNYIIKRCPALTLLNITYIVLRRFRDHIPQLISKLKYLKALYLGCNVNSFKEILTQISIHCKNFSTLGITVGKIRHEEASAIVTLLPKIKCLKLSGIFLSQEDLKLILGACRELQFVDVNFSTFGITLGKIRHEDASAIVTVLPKIKCLKLRGIFLSQEVLKLILGVCRELQFVDVNFSTFGITLGKIRHEDVSAIVTLLSKIKCLKLSGTFLSQEDLKLILGVCRELQFVVVSRCLGFEEDDNGILSMASHIGAFHSKGAMMGDVFLRGRDRTPVSKLGGGSYFC